ncbi:MAG: hypothetical protein ACW9W3_03285 [Candidatus Nitrosopumilus sp. bin_68KS]
MTSGETILKLTDYPFSYSIMGIISGILGFGISDNQLVFLGMAGAFGTFLAVVDPMGWGLRKNAEDRIKKDLDHPKNEPQELEKEYKISALKSKSINFEIEKIIGLFYFIVILTVFLIAVGFSTVFLDKITINDTNGNSIFPATYFQGIYGSIALLSLIVLIVKANRFWKDLDGKIIIAGFHQIAINDDNATQTSVESMTRAVEQNDWTLAKIWQDKIKEEIKYKKGKRELIIKSADTVYSPLHLESSKFKLYLEDIMANQFTDFKTEQWNKIKQSSLQSIIEDTDFRHRIEEFYKKLDDYNFVVHRIFGELSKIINNNFSNAFSKNVQGVEFHLDSPNSGNTVHLHTYAMSELHPMELQSTTRKFGSFKLRTITGRQSEDMEYTELNLFDNVWKLVLEDVKKNELLIKTKQYLKDLKIENEKLMKTYSDKIEMQWKV